MFFWFIIVPIFGLIILLIFINFETIKKFFSKFKKIKSNNNLLKIDLKEKININEKYLQLIASDFSCEKKILIEKSNKIGHSLVVGGSGSGKTEKYFKTMIIINSLLKNSPNMVINDLKGDEINLNERGSYGSLYKELSGFLNNQGYNVYKLDFFSNNWINEFVETNQFNVLNYIFINRKNKYKIDDIIDNFVQQLFPLINDKDRFWVDSSRIVVKNIIKYMIETNIVEEDFNLFTLIKIWKDFPKYIEYYFNVNNKNIQNREPKIFNLIQNNINLINSKSFKETSATITAELEKFNNNLLKKISEKHNFKIDKFNQEKSVLFIQTNGMNENYNIIISLIIKQLIDSKIETNNNIVTLLMLDEFNNLGKFPNFSNYLDTVRSKNIFFSLGIQSISKFEEKYGDINKFSNNYSFSYLFGSTTNKKEIDYFNDYFHKSKRNSKTFNSWGDISGSSWSDNEEKIIEDINLKVNENNFVWIKSKNEPLKGKKIDYTSKIHKKIFIDKFKLDNIIDLSHEKETSETNIKNKKLNLNITNQPKTDTLKKINDFLKNDNKMIGIERNNLKNKLEKVLKYNNWEEKIIEIILNEDMQQSFKEKIIEIITK